MKYKRYSSDSSSNRLLIEPQGIEIKKKQQKPLKALLLIEPQGIEIPKPIPIQIAIPLLIEPQGIEMLEELAEESKAKAFNRTTRN